MAASFPAPLAPPVASSPMSSTPTAPTVSSAAAAAPVRPSRAPPKRRAAPKPKLISLSNDQKLELCEHSAAHPTLAWHELAQWAKRHFRLRKPLSTTTVYRILRKHDELKQMTPKELQYRRQPSSGVWWQFETRLRDWIVALADQGMHIDIKIIRTEAHRLRDELDTTGELSKRVFSNGWLASFMLRNDLSLRNLHKGGSVVVSQPVQTQRKKKV